MTPDTILKSHLSNGLTIHLKEIHTAPLISHWVWYRVGSRDERPGRTGVSHWVEHMQFKGTPKYPPELLDKAISREGGVWNAFTYLDWTTYYETLPAAKIDMALDLEADRMVNSNYDPEEVASERNVVISEREGSENEPLFRLGEAMQNNAFRVHTYHHEVVGEKADLQNMQRDDLYDHYRTYYLPNNAIVAAAGDFDAQEMLAKMEKIYGGLQAGPTPPRPAQPEPPSQAETRLEVHGPGETTYLQVVYHAPAANEADFAAFTVLDSLLSGPSSLNMFGGGGISNKTSRLYRALVEKELAVGVGGGLQATLDPYLYDLTITLRPDRKTDELQQALDDEIKRMQDKTVSADEIHRAAKQARAMFIYGSENITNQAFWLGYADMFAGYEWFTGYVDRLAAITPADVQRVAQTWLRPENRLVGVYVPDGEEETE